MTKDELKLAFQKAFQMGQNYWYYADHEFESYNKKSDAIRAKFNEMVKETIEEALAQPEQEPVAKYSDIVSDGGLDPRNTTPPQRTWVGLTDEEIAEALGDEIDSVYMTDFRRVEAKLKEKNT